MKASGLTRFKSEGLEVDTSFATFSFHGRFVVMVSPCRWEVWLQVAKRIGILVWSVECGVWNVGGSGVSVECGVWSLECVG